MSSTGVTFRDRACAVSSADVWLLWREARPAVQVTFLLRFLTAAAMAGVSPTAPALRGLLLGALAWILATWHVYLLNGVCDQTEDRCNGSSRPLASGRVPVATARAVARSLAVLALVCGAAASWQQAALTAAMLGLGWLYSAAPKPAKTSVSGSMMVIAAGGALTYLAGWHAAGGTRPSVELLVLAVSMSLWMGLVGLTKDLSDIRGDRLAGRRTLPILLGDRRGRALLAGQAIGVGLLGCGLAWTCAERLVPAAVVLLCGAVVLAVSLVPRFSDGAWARRRRPYRIFRAIQYALHLIVLGQAVL